MTSSPSMICVGCNHSFAETALFCPNCGRPKVREATGDALVGKVLGERFMVQELIGQGGSGTIYRAEHVTLRRKVAIKVLHQELSRDDLAVERFRREATTVAEIDNEHIVEIHDFGRTPDGRLYLAMELLEGETLDTVIARDGTLTMERAADILIQVGEAMMEAHAIGYVHRDIRPRNIYLAQRRGKANFVKLLDFGLAKLVETEQGAASTNLGMTFGDPRYMSPEAARGDRIDRRADLYQLGCVAYEMLTGQPPFTGNRVFDILTKQVTDIPTPLPSKRQGVPLWMEAAVAKMLAKDPENRFATTTRMVEALRRGLETGEVMEDEVARRRESIPPPSVSRVMEKMGLPVDAAPPAEPAVRSNAPAGAVPAPAPVTASTPNRAPAAAVPAPPVLPSAPAGAVPAPARPAAKVAPVAPAAPVSAAPSAPIDEDSGRKRTGTPKVGVPIVTAEAKPSESQPVPTVKKPKLRNDEPRDPSQRPRTGLIDAKMPRAPSDANNVSQSWFDEDGAPLEESQGRLGRSRRSSLSASSTDVGLYDETAPPRHRWALLATIVVVLGIGTAVYAVSRNSGPGATKTGASDEVGRVAEGSTNAPALTPSLIDAAPSEIIAQGSAGSNVPATGSATPAAVDTPKPADKVADATKPADKKVDTKLAVATKPADKTPKVSTMSSRRPPSNDLAIAPPTTPSHTVTREPPDTTPADPDGAGKSEFFANLGQQQLGSGDIAGAAGNFKKAIDLDSKNIVAVTGQGEIALRQGAFADAIAHLTKAGRLAPKSSRVFTLLGDAYLSSAQMKDAAANYKKALQLDPDNARARDGYNEASTHVPPPADETP